MKDLKTKKYYKKKNHKRKNVELEKSYEQKFKLKGKIINHQIKNGNKRTCEITLLQCLKTFQKTSSKNYKNIIQLAVVNATPTFLLKEIKNKKYRKKKKQKENIIPFIPKENLRISYSIKSIIVEALKKKSVAKKSYKNLAQELLLSARKKGDAIEKKKEIQEQALKRKKQLARFRWF